MELYVSGMPVAFIMGFVLFMIQGIQRRKENEETLMQVLFGALFGAVLAALVSWISVFPFVVMIFGGMATGISDKNMR